MAKQQIFFRCSCLVQATLLIVRHVSEYLYCLTMFPTLSNVHSSMLAKAIRRGFVCLLTSARYHGCRPRIGKRMTFIIILLMLGHDRAVESPFVASLEGLIV